MRMNGLWIRSISRLSSARFFSSLAALHIKFSRFASSVHGSQEVFDEMLQSTFCRAATESLAVSQCL